MRRTTIAPSRALSRRAFSTPRPRYQPRFRTGRRVALHSAPVSIRPVALLLIAAVALASSPAAAQRRGRKRDTVPPVVEHTPLVEHDGAGPLLVEARIVDAGSAVFEPTLLVRLAGTETFQRVAMTPKPGQADVFVAAVPPAILVGDIEYFVEAFDENGNGPARVGDETTPFKVSRAVPAPLNPPPPPPPGDVEEGPSPLVLGAGIAVGTVVLVGAAVGVGLAVYALRPAAPEVVTIQVRAPSPLSGALLGGAP